MTNAFSSTGTNGGAIEEGAAHASKEEQVKVAVLCR